MRKNNSKIVVETVYVAFSPDGNADFDYCAYNKKKVAEMLDKHGKLPTYKPGDFKKFGWKIKKIVLTFVK